MRICIVTHKFVQTDGQGRINYEIARHLSQRGHELMLVSSVIEPALAAAKGVAWRRVSPPAWLPTALLRNEWFAIAAARAVLHEPAGYDILQQSGCITRLAADVNIAMFVHSHWRHSAAHPVRSVGGAYGAYQWLYTARNARLEREAFRRSCRVVALSEAVHQSLVADAGVPESRIVTICPGVEPGEFRPLLPGERSVLRTEIGIPENELLLLFAGDIRSNRKNLDLVLLALARLGTSVHLAVAGSAAGSPYPRIARELGLGGQVHFLGHRDDMSTVMRGADAFVFPTHYDTFALVIAEAMASGLPVITTRAAGAASLIEDQVNGFLLRDGHDLEGLMRIVERLDKDRDLARRLGAAGRVRAELMRWQAMAERYEELYERVMRERPSRRARGPIDGSERNHARCRP